MTLGFLGRLFGRKKAIDAGVRMKRGTDLVRTPLVCAECKRPIANFTPDRGVAVCTCGKRWAIVNYELQPLPKGFKIEDYEA